jgi:hypothetical protein
MDYYIKYEQPNNTWSRERINVGRMARNCIVSWGEFLQQFASKHKPQTFSRVCLRLKLDVYRWKRNVSLFMCHVIVQSLIQLFFMFWCAFVYVSVFPSSQYCKSDQTCLYSYFLWLEHIIMGLEILKHARSDGGTSKHDTCAKNSLRLFNVTRHMSGETFQFPTVNAPFQT